MSQRMGVRRETCNEAVSRILLAHPGLFTMDYVRLTVGHSTSAIKAALHRLKLAKLARNERIVSQANRGHWNATRWYPTPSLKRMIDRGDAPITPRSLRAEEALDDDGWTPPTTYMTASRAYALGIKR